MLLEQRFNTIKAYALSKSHSRLDFPFGEDVYVFKVQDKMFALMSFNKDQIMLNLKCDPDEGAALRDIFPAIKPGYHMNKRHWISIYFQSDNQNDLPPEGEIERLIDHSFNQVVAKMPKKQRTAILVHV